MDLSSECNRHCSKVRLNLLAYKDVQLTLSLPHTSVQLLLLLLQLLLLLLVLLLLLLLSRRTV